MIGLSMRRGERTSVQPERDYRLTLESRCHRITVFGALDSDYNYVESLQHLLQFAGEVIESAVLRFSRSLVLRAAALDFYELALDLPITLGLPVLTLPSPTLTYVCLLSTEAASLSRICGIIGRRVAIQQASSHVPSC